MGEHSPGPWSVEYGQSSNHREGYYVVDAGGRALWDNGGSDGGVCYEESVARLIAAAPQLLSLVERFLDVPTPATFEQARALLTRLGDPGDGTR